MNENNHGSGKIRQIALLTALAVLSLSILSACGTDTGTGSAATPTAAASAPAVTDAQAAPTATTEAMPADMTNTPAESAPTAPAAVGSTEGTPGAVAQTTGSSTQVQATLKEWAIDLSQKEVSAGKITFVVSNAGQMNHNLTVTDDSGTLAQTPIFGSGDGPQTLEVDLKPGTYTLICSLPGHAARGQKTTLVVK